MTYVATDARAALDGLTRRASSVRIAVVGDVILDRFLHGAVERISPEAPVPVVTVDVDREDRDLRLGGAGNVAHNLRVLGVHVDLLAVVGADAMAECLREKLEFLGVRHEGVVATRDRPTATKTRVIAQNQQVVRLDREKPGPLSDEAQVALAGRLAQVVPEADAVIVSDYGKGVISARVMASIRNSVRADHGFVVVDPAPLNASLYRWADLLTPNVKEAEAMAGLAARSDEEADHAGRRLMERLDVRAVLVTRGEAGMTLVEGERPCQHIRARARDVFDVTGAGDTTVAVLTAAAAAGATLGQSASLANVAAGIVVGKVGTAAVTAQELRNAATNGARPASFASRT